MGSKHSNQKSEQQAALVLEEKLKKYQIEENNESLKNEILAFFQWEEEHQKTKNDICNFFTLCKPVVLKLQVDSF